MALPLPPDPYKILSVPIDAQLPQIRSAHRKLVLKCHPDKVQDAAEKLLKQDEFQKVQQAYELLSDDVRRTRYDEQVKLVKRRDELREEMARATKQTTYEFKEFEIRTAEPRKYTTTTYSTSSRPKPPTRSNTVYSESQKSRSYEDVPTPYPDEHRAPKQYKSNEANSTAKRSARPANSERDRESRRADDERKRQERKREEDKRTAKESKKARDKDRRKVADEKDKVQKPYIESDSDECREPRREKKGGMSQRDESIRSSAAAIAEAQRDAVAAQHRGEAARAEAVRAHAIRPAPMTEKHEGNLFKATQYLQQSRASEPVDAFSPPLRRADTYHGAYTVRYEAAGPKNVYEENSDDEPPRRPSASRMKMRRSSETPTKSRDGPKLKEGRRPSARAEYSSGDQPAPPSLQKQASEPVPRRNPSRSKADYSRTNEAPPPPPMPPRSSTFTQGFNPDSIHSPERDHARTGGRKRHEDYSGESDSEPPIIQTASPRIRSPTRTTRYKVADGRSVPTAKARVPRESEGYFQPRERSESPLRPVMRTAQSARQAPTRSSPAAAYYSPYPEAPQSPYIVEPRKREAARATTVPSPYANVAYSTSYGPEDISYGKVPYNPSHRRGSEGAHRAEYQEYSPQPQRRGPAAVY